MNSVLSDEELTLIRDSVLLPVLMDVIKNNTRELQHSKLSVISLYIKTTEVLLDTIHADLVAVKKELRQRDIKVVPEDRIDYALYHKIYYRGYNENFGIMKETIKAELSVKLGNYVSHLENKLREKIT